MAELTTIARPYAKAAFQYALESSALEEWSNTLGHFALIAGDASVKALLSKPDLTAEKKAQFFVSVIDESVSADTIEHAKNLLMQLAGHKRLATLPAIFVLFEALLAEHQKTVDVNVTSAFPLSEAEAEKLLASLKKRLGREVKMESEVDDSLIGGVIVHAGDLVIDASVKGKLAKLTNELNT